MEINNTNKNQWKNRRINNQKKKGWNMNKKILDAIFYSVKGKGDNEETELLTF